MSIVIVGRLGTRSSSSSSLSSIFLPLECESSKDHLFASEERQGGVSRKLMVAILVLLSWLRANDRSWRTAE